MNEPINELFEMAAHLRDSGLTSGWLLFIGALFSITLVIAVRELSQWYLGVNRLRKDLEEIRHTLSLIQTQLAQHSTPKALEANAAHELEFVETKRADRISFTSPDVKASQNFPLQR